ncbi:VWA domain-containing protein, partial [bacterium]|nr:VWA domain-containing protein [bacterium]
ESGGVYIENVKSQDDIKTMLSEIERLSEKKELKSEEVARFIPLFYYPLGLALFLLLIATSSMSKRVTVALPSAFLLFTFLASPTKTEAGILDFMELKNAKEAYEKGDFVQSAELYEKHAKATQNAQSYFNAGNSLYKQGKYDDALKAYESAHFQSKSERAENYANIGNTNAKLANEESLQNALKAYEESLKLQADKEVQENYEAVKKALDEQQKEQKEEEKDQKKENKEEDKQNKEDKKEQQNQDQEGEKASQDQKENSQKDEKSQKKDEQSQQNEQKSQKENSEDEKKNSEEMKNDAENKEKKDELTNNEKTKQDLKELQQNKSDLQESLQKAKEANKDKMSDAEEEKWIQQLNMNQNSYMYMLNNENKNEEKTDEKPW